MKWGWRVLVGLVVVGVGVVGARELGEDEVGELLARLEASRADGGAVTVEFREERTSRLYAEPLVTEGRMTFAPPNRFRRETRGRSESVMISDGQTLWIEYPEFGEVEKYDLREGAAAAGVVPLISASLSFAGLERMFRVRVTEEDGGVLVLDLEPKARDQRRHLKNVRVVLGPDLRARQVEWQAADGDRAVTTFRGERQVPIEPGDFVGGTGG